MLDAHIERMSRYLFAARWLRISQVFWFIWRRLVPPRVPPAPDPEAVRGIMSGCAYPRVVQPNEPVFEFVGLRRPATSPVDWHPDDAPRLWRYNLHYFDFLLWDSFPAELKARLIDDWISANPPGTDDAWEPYTTSLRIVNWIKYIDALNEAPPDAWLQSLLHQSVWLRANLEYHILANHFLKNGKALVYAGVFFTGPTGRRLLSKGLAIFDQEVTEQLLADGGHYERSLMYHGIVLEDVLDVLNVAAAVPECFEKDVLQRLNSKAQEAARFLDDLRGGDGNIPLFNDAAFGIAPEPEELLRYAERAAGYQRAPRPSVPMLIDKPATGYFGYRHGKDTLLIDCGQIAPDYQPGHAHCDMLSFELCLEGRRIVVDTGTFGYEPGERRQYLRGTAAHNTVEIDGQDQSEVWGGFRVSRRARPLDPRIESFSRQGMRFCGAHSGYRRLPQRINHQRDVDVEFGGVWSVTDRLTGAGDCAARSYLHLAPELSFRELSHRSWAINDGERDILSLTVADNCTAVVEMTEYYPQFGIAQSQQTLIVSAAGGLPLELGYRLERRERD